MKTIKKIMGNIALMMAIAAITACTANQQPEPDPTNAVGINTLIHHTLTHTRAEGTQAYTPEGGTLTLFYGKMDAADNETTGYTCTDGLWTTAKPLYWNNLDANTQGKYPFFAAAPAKPIDTPAVPANQSEAIAYTDADQLMAYTTATPLAEVSLNFQHVLTQLTVTLTATDIEPDKIAAATLIVGPAKTNYSLSYTQPTTETPAKATATGQAATITPHKAATGNFHAILPPQEFEPEALTLTFTIDGKSYTWKNPEATTLAAGTNTHISLVAKKSNIIVGNVSLENWIDVNIDGELKLTDIMDGGTIALPQENGTFILSTIDEEVDLVALYDWDGTNLTSITLPITWDQLKADTHSFRATFEPNTAAAEGHEKDYLAATTNNVDFGAVLNFEQDNALTHANAQLTLTITNDGTLSSAEMATATASVNVNKTSYCGTNGEIGLDNADKDVTLLSTEADASIHTAILAPQTLDGIALIIDGKSYTVSKPILLEGGKHTRVAAHIVGSKISISVAFAPWTEGGTVEDGNVEMDPKQ